MTQRQQRQIEMHKELAYEYDRRYRPAFSMVFQEFWNEEIIRRLDLEPGAVVLDLGCGTGILLADLAGAGYRGTGLDISHEMLVRARALFPVTVGDGSRLPFRDGVFDAVVARGAIHHIPGISDVLAEVLRVLKPGGRVVFSEPSNDSPLVRLARWIMYLKSRHFDEDDVAFRSAGVTKIMNDAGFTALKLERFGFLAYTLAGFPDILPVLKYVPFSVPLTRLLVRIDRILARLPGIRYFSLHIMIRAAKP